MYPTCTKTLCSIVPPVVASVTLLCLYAAAAAVPDRQDKTPKELDPKVVEAWKKAGAKAGWLQPNAFGFWLFFEEKPKAANAFPAFRVYNFGSNALAKLPLPTVPFALQLTGVTDGQLKELSTLKTLQALNLTLMRVGDA